jgi:RNA polymerase sigma factor (sigma-70 family)
MELAPVLYSCFPAYAADCGLDAAGRARMNYIRRVQEGTACDLTNEAAYLRKVAFRAARRRQRKEPSTVPIWLAVAKPQDQEEDPTAKYADLHAAIASLPQRQRQAVALHFIEGMSLRKTAREMGVSPWTVSQYVKRGLTSLRKTLSEKKPDRAGARAS